MKNVTIVVIFGHVVFVVAPIILIVVCFPIYLNNAMKKGQRMYTDDFSYCYIKEIGDNRSAENGDYICILGLTKEGDQKEAIIIPDYIENKPVVQIGRAGGFMSSSSGISTSGIYTKLYLPKSIQTIYDSKYNRTGVKVFEQETL